MYGAFSDGMLVCVHHIVWLCVCWECDIMWLYVLWVWLYKCDIVWLCVLCDCMNVILCDCVCCVSVAVWMYVLLCDYVCVLWVWYCVIVCVVFLSVVKHNCDGRAFSLGNAPQLISYSAYSTRRLGLSNPFPPWAVGNIKRPLTTWTSERKLQLWHWK